jgi:hypothetical protein
MRKLYFIVSRPATSKDNIITGVVANSTGRNATADETATLVRELIAAGASQSLVDALRDSTYPGPVSVYERRAAAREECRVLNAFNGLFNWTVIGIGESVRKPVRNVLGWRLMYGEHISSFNDPDLGATVAIDEGITEKYDEENWLYETRAAARQARSSEELGSSYRIVPVYADA